MFVSSSDYQRDRYNCLKCEGWIGRKDLFCNSCGHEFSGTDVEIMISRSTFFKRWHAPYHSSFDNELKCKRCNTCSTLTEKYCKQCGLKFKSNEIDSVNNHRDNMMSNFIFGSIFFIIMLSFLTLIMNVI